MKIMKNGKDLKKIFAIMAIVSAIIIAIPNTVSIFGGQHRWYDLSPDPNDVPCGKCHADISEELYQSSYVHEGMTCAMCHRTTFTDYTYASGRGTGSEPGREAHSASTLTCMKCHDGSGRLSDGGVNHASDPEYLGMCTNACHGSYGYSTPYFAAGGFNLTTELNFPNDTGEKAAHLSFVLSSKDENSTLMEGTNEACIACHTGASVNITFNISQRYEIELNKTCDWEVGDFIEGDYTEVVV